LTLLEWRPPAIARLRVRCSKGTYVRALAADLGKHLGTVAHLAGLRRIASGPFGLAEALPLAEVERRLGAGEPARFIGLAEALAHLPAITPSDDLAAALWQGKKVPVESVGLAGDSAGRFRILRGDGSLLVVAEVQGGIMRTLRGFQPESIALPAVAADCAGQAGPGLPEAQVDRGETAKLSPRLG
jgi:tRNA pseudouridine55 synthase